MADKTEFLQAIDDAILDADSLERFINGSDSETVLTRLSAEYPTLQNMIKQIVQSKGVLPASVYERLAELPTSPAPTVGDLALVINDAVDKNGVYKYKDAKWTLMSWSELNASSLYFVESKIYEVSGKNKVYANVSNNCHLSETGGKPFLKDILPADTVRGVRTAILAVKPNTKYIIRLPEVTDMFRVAVFDSKMGYVGVYTDEHITYGRMVYDQKEGEVKIGSYEVQTGSDDHVLAVTYSLRKVPSRGIEIYEANSDGRKDGKNIALQDYKLKGVALSEIANSTKYKPAPIETAVTYWIPVKANTTYTISKQPSNRLVVTQMEEFTESVSGGTAYRVRNRLLYRDDSKNSVTVTTSASAYFMGLYVSNASENPFIQVEEGGNQTLWVTAGYADDVEKPLSSNTSLTLSATDGDMSDTLLQAVESVSGSKLTLKSGVYRISKTIEIPSNTTIECEGDVVIQALAGGSFTKVTWRHLQVEVFLRTNESSSNVKLKNITVKGTGVTNNNFMQWGIGLQGSNHKLQDVNVYDINWIDSEDEEVRAGGNGWGLVVYKAKDIRVLGGRFEGSGYENVGTESVSNVLFDGIYCGKGWRTSFQIHRSSTDITLVNSTVKQVASSAAQTHAAVTMHGMPDAEIKNVKIINCAIDAQVSPNMTKPCGGIQTVAGAEYNVTISNCTISTNKMGIATSSDANLAAPTNWIITNNTIKSIGKPIKFTGVGSIISNNIYTSTVAADIADTNNVVTNNLTYNP